MSTKRKYRTVKMNVYESDEVIGKVKLRKDCLKCFNKGVDERGMILGFDECQSCEIWVCEKHQDDWEQCPECAEEYKEEES